MWRSDCQPSSDGEELGAALGFELPPQPVGALKERNVLRALEVRGSEDARVSVRRAPVVAGSEALEADDLRATSSQPPRRHRAHLSESPDRDVTAVVRQRNGGSPAG